MENFINTKVVRCEPYPLVDPQGYVAGFIFTCLSNGKSVYRDTFITFTELFHVARCPTHLNGDHADTTQVVMDLAYRKLYTVVEAWLCAVRMQPPLLGCTYNPPTPPPTTPVNNLFPFPNGSPFAGFTPMPMPKYDPLNHYSPTEGRYDGEEYYEMDEPQHSEPSASFPPFCARKSAEALLDTAQSTKPMVYIKKEPGEQDIICIADE